MASEHRKALILSDNVIACSITAPTTKEIQVYQDQVGVKIFSRLALTSKKDIGLARKAPADISFVISEPSIDHCYMTMNRRLVILASA